MDRKYLISVALTLAFSAFAHAGILTGITTNSGTEVVVNSINKFSVKHNDMGPMKVTASFSFGPDDIGYWSSTATDGIAVGGNGLFELKERNDTFTGNVWRLGNLNPNAHLTKLVIEGAPGNTVFDLNGDGTGPLVSGSDSTSEGTGSPLPFGSERGYTFLAENLDDIHGVFPADLHVSVTYSNIVRLASDAMAKGDVWTTLTIQFGGPAIGLPIYDGQGAITFHFNADTDTFDLLAEPVPEPSSLSLLLGFGLIGAWRYRRSQRTSAHS